ncbi:hypothetical protein [Aestuariivivens sp. NBU2969]|uniref:hypothetical protein n=1 Tax=Aestuariivivens sp. NBU2969 TaxID=2873267 RepID=UPI001CBD8AF9|nr:hypothetical protein [Aestuariivivens sp. NBU2969]
MKKLFLLLFIPILSYSQDDIERYKLYPTENMYTFIKLDTSNGLLWQVQYGVGDVDAFQSVLSDWKISLSVEEITEEYNERYKYWEENYENNTELSSEDIEYFKPQDLDVRLTYAHIAKIGRYKLYPTQNMYNFILLDVIDGYTYQVQWSIDKDKRLVLPIR